jgi:hypothetical protein
VERRCANCHLRPERHLAAIFSPVVLLSPRPAFHRWDDHQQALPFGGLGESGIGGEEAAAAWAAIEENDRRSELERVRCMQVVESQQPLGVVPYREQRVDLRPPDREKLGSAQRRAYSRRVELS